MPNFRKRAKWWLLETGGTCNGEMLVREYNLLVRKLWEAFRPADFSQPPQMRNKSSWTQSRCSGGKGGGNSI